MRLSLMLAVFLLHNSYAFEWAQKPGACLPEFLHQTGIFSNTPNLEVHKELYPFEPQYPLWTDGATKRRYAYIPPGEKINSSNMNSWKFPIGTIFWKEFSFKNLRAETRVIAKTREGWVYGSYLWNEKQTRAKLVSKDGMNSVTPIGKFELGVEIRHDIPSKIQCKACHNLEIDMVLGFDALQLSDDRDPGALNWGTSKKEFSELRVSTLVSNNLLTHFPSVPEKVKAKSALERSALGYLHGNCGNCHNPKGAAQHTKMFLKHEMLSPHEEQAISTTIHKKTLNYALPGFDKEYTYRILPGNPALSAVWYRMSNRLKNHQMPKIGSKVVDQAGSNLILNWIFNMPTGPSE